MKYLRLHLTPASTVIHPIDQVIADIEDVSRIALHHLDIQDSAVTLFYELTGDINAVTTCLEAASNVFESNVIEEDNTVFAYFRVHRQQTEPGLLNLVAEHAFIIDYPIEFKADGVVTTLIGTKPDLRRALQSTHEEFTITIQEAGRYSPTDSTTLHHLPTRQREVFLKAIEYGYYDRPRYVTHDHLAQELDCSPSTVDEHLRKAESRVISRLIN